MRYLDYPERQVFGSQNLPCFFYAVDKTHPRYNMPFHWHPLFEILHVYEGSFQLHLNERTFLLGPGDTALIQNGITHGGTPQSDRECRYECLLIDLNAISLFSSSIRQYEPKLTDLFNSSILLDGYCPASETEITELILRMLRPFQDRDSVDALSLIGYTYLLFSAVIRRHAYTETPLLQYSKKFEALKKMLSYIEEHYQERLDLDTLASCANLNPSYFCRYFKELTHRTPIDYLNFYRIEVACEQMVYSNRPLTEIAYDCGFTDSSYFIKVFRHYKHMSPTQYMLGAKGPS